MSHYVITPADNAAIRGRGEVAGIERSDVSATPKLVVLARSYMFLAAGREISMLFAALDSYPERRRGERVWVVSLSVMVFSKAGGVAGLRA